MKLTAPTTALQVGGVLKDLFWNKTVGRYSLNGSEDGQGNTIIEGEISLSVAEIVEILNAGGEVNEYLMAFQADIEILEDFVPAGLPNQLDAFGNIKTFLAWFDSSAEIWINAPLIEDATRITFYTNPIGTSKSQYLSGTEMYALFLAMNATRHITVLTPSQFVAEAGWTKI